MVEHLQAYQRSTEQRLTQLGNDYARLATSAAQVLKPQGWSAEVSEVAFYDRGTTIPEWQDIGCAVQFEASNEISVVTIGCSMSRAYGYSTLHYQITNKAGGVVVPRDVQRLASTNYSAISASQTAVGRVFAHTFTPGVYEARLWVRTTHANSTDWAATLNVYSASIAVRNY